MKVLLSALFVCLAFALSTQSTINGVEDQYLDREVVQQVVRWLAQAARSNEQPLPFCTPLPHKRNSEIINSILGLPKNLKDAGLARAQKATNPFVSCSPIL